MKASEKKMKNLFTKKISIIPFDEGLKRTINWHKKRDNLKLIFLLKNKLNGKKCNISSNPG